MVRPFEWSGQALPSGEAELYAIGLGVADSVLLKSFLDGAKLFKAARLITICNERAVGKSSVARQWLSKNTRHVDLT